MLFFVLSIRRPPRSKRPDPLFPYPTLEQGAQGEGPRRVRLLFDRPAQFDLSAVDTARLPQIGALSASPDGVTLEIPAGSRLKVERSGTKVVLEIGRAHVRTPVTNALLVCRLLLDKKIPMIQ